MNLLLSFNKLTKFTKRTNDLKFVTNVREWRAQTASGAVTGKGSSK